MGGIPLSQSPTFKAFEATRRSLEARAASGGFNGRGIASCAIVNGHLVITYTDGKTQDVGLVVSIPQDLLNTLGVSELPAYAVAGFPAAVNALDARLIALGF
jgi:hypothetical protein